jgi:AraC family ethanolamine operon transcriptional activator
MITQSFDDFDAWADAVSGASLRLVCDTVEERAWTLGVVPLGDVVLQVATEGGGNLCYGMNTHPGPLVFIPLSLASEHVVNAERLDDGSVFLIPRGSDFRIRIRRRAHAWCSLALPATGVAATCAGGRVACAPGSLPRLRDLVGRIGRAIGGYPPGSVAHLAAGRELAAAVGDCLPAAVPDRAATGRPRLDRGRIIRRAMEVIETAPSMPAARDLAARIGVTERTLQRTFQETYGVPPKKYLLARELHAVRRVLLAGAPRDRVLADVLARRGIWEFGRFAARYRRQFGELPSATLRQARG